ncbi:hypothetical protein QM565_06435 [Geitlerinema splendidum]|jgi:hypothetical protein|nr:hypothetical protein [Geitlerinema splendidum]
MIAIVSTFKESYKDVREHLPQWIKVAFAPFIVWLIGLAFMGMGLYLSGEFNFTVTQEGILQNEPEGSLLGDFFTVVHYILETFAALVLYVNAFRYAVLGEGGDKWWTFSLNKRLVKMFLYYLLIIVLCAVYGGVAGGITVGTYFLVENVFLTGLLGVLFVVGLVYFATRLTLTFLYVAVDQKEPLRTSWHLMKGSVLRVLGLFFLIGLVIIGLTIVGSAILGFGGWLLSLINMWLGAIVFALFIPFGLFVWLVSIALMTKTIALVNKQLMEKK